MIREFNNPELAPRNSFHVAQRAARLIEFDRTEDLQELFEKGMPDPWYVLGGGNNVLFTQDYPGTLLTPVAQGIRIEVVSRMLGHTNIKTTQIYAKVTDDMLAKGFDEMADIYSAKYSLAQ